MEQIVLVVHKSVQIADDHWRRVTEVYEVRPDETIGDFLRRVFGPKVGPGDLGTLVVVSDVGEGE
jgi:hypothetical protein